MSSSAWLSSVANLLVFFRWLTLWLDIVLLGLSMVPLTILGVCIFAVTGVTAVFNLTVAIIQHNEKKRLIAGVVPVPSVAVIVLDYIFGLVFLAAWILSSFALGASPYYNYSQRNGYWYSFSFFEAYTTVGCLVAVHFHLFLAGVSTHIRRRQAQGVTFVVETSRTNAETKTSEADQKA